MHFSIQIWLLLLINEQELQLTDRQRDPGSCIAVQDMNSDINWDACFQAHSVVVQSGPKCARVCLSHPPGVIIILRRHPTRHCPGVRFCRLSTPSHYFPYLSACLLANLTVWAKSFPAKRINCRRKLEKKYLKILETIFKTLVNKIK